MQKIGTTAGGTVIVEMAAGDYELLADVIILLTGLTPNTPTMTGGGAGTPVCAPPVSPASASWRTPPARHSSRSEGGRLGGKKSAPKGGRCKFCGAKVRRKDMIACLKGICRRKLKAEQGGGATRKALCPASRASRQAPIGTSAPTLQAKPDRMATIRAAVDKANARLGKTGAELRGISPAAEL